MSMKVIYLKEEYEQILSSLIWMTATLYPSYQTLSQHKGTTGIELISTFVAVRHNFSERVTTCCMRKMLHSLGRDIHGCVVFGVCGGCSVWCLETNFCSNSLMIHVPKWIIKYLFLSVLLNPIGTTKTT